MVSCGTRFNFAARQVVVVTTSVVVSVDVTTSGVTVSVIVLVVGVPVVIVDVEISVEVQVGVGTGYLVEQKDCAAGTVDNGWKRLYGGALQTDCALDNDRIRVVARAAIKN